jgi:hypothetical protein
MGRLTLIFAAIISLPLWVRGQVTDCPQWPAPCPHSEEITKAMDFASRTRDNNVTQQEMAMEANLRNLFTDILQKIAKPNHWQLYELNESDYDRPNTFIGYPKWEATPYEKRPPHAYKISFILVVNKDSLKAWRDWYTGDFTAQSNQLMAGAANDSHSEANNKLLQVYMDSVQYYAQMSAKYLQDHQAQYMSDIHSNNKKGIKEHEDKMAWYRKKSDAFVKKYQDAQNGIYTNSANSLDDLNKKKIAMTEKFANASIALVHFSVNPEQAGFGITDADQKCVLPQTTFTVSGAFYAGMLHNTEPKADKAYEVGLADYLFDNPTHIATVLIGGWLHKHDGYNYIHAAYTADQANTNLTGIKSAKCDAVQNLALYIEGRPDRIKSILNQMDVAALRKLINP